MLQEGKCIGNYYKSLLEPDSEGDVVIGIALISLVKKGWGYHQMKENSEAIADWGITGQLKLSKTHSMQLLITSQRYFIISEALTFLK